MILGWGGALAGVAGSAGIIGKPRGRYRRGLFSLMERGLLERGEATVLEAAALVAETDTFSEIHLR